MEAEVISDPPKFVASLGGLHDVRIDKFVIDTDAETLSLVLDDLNKNFADTPDYQGRRPSTLVFLGATELQLDVALEEGVRISHAEIIADSATFKLEVDLNLGGGSASGGRRSITARFRSLALRDAI